MEDIRECPVCEGPAFLGEGHLVQVFCHGDCKMSGPLEDSKEKATSAWNRICEWHDSWRVWD